MKEEQKNYDIFDLGDDADPIVVFENGDGGMLISDEEFDAAIDYLNSLPKEERRRIAEEEGLC
ncbi:MULTISPECIES: hypothetical protein [Megamonas]|jgi:hypothetical protein|uniref:hypothetical protein n=1 Tax=Megamonas TaxID=158846 RepID=UPI000E42A18A|nr:MULTISPECIES: hypothetical protein [Megamonas]RGO06085.1 hypothetical protein DXB32_01570 [Megamonas rupellensis]